MPTPGRGRPGRSPAVRRASPRTPRPVDPRTNEDMGGRRGVAGANARRHGGLCRAEAGVRWDHEEGAVVLSASGDEDGASPAGKESTRTTGPSRTILVGSPSQAVASRPTRATGPRCPVSAVIRAGSSEAMPRDRGHHAPSSTPSRSCVVTSRRTTAPGPTAWWTASGSGSLAARVRLRDQHRTWHSPALGGLHFTVPLDPGRPGSAVRRGRGPEARRSGVTGALVQPQQPHSEVARESREALSVG